MDQATFAVLLSCGVYLLYVLVPLIPAIIIYKMFPDTRVTAQGTISNWKIKAGGAFGAYITVVLLGYVVVARTEQIIGGMGACMWTISGEVELKDAQGNNVAGNNLFKAMEVTLVPDIIDKGSEHIKLRIPAGNDSSPSSMFTLTIPHFGEETIDLSGHKYKTKIDYYGKKVDITEPIVIKQYLDPSDTTGNLPATTAAQYLQPLAAGPSPVPNTATP